MKHSDLTITDLIRSVVTCARVTTLATAAAVILAPAVFAQPAPGEDYGMVRVGESLFRGYCTSCHGATAEGDGPLASSLRVEPANLTSINLKNGGTFPFDRVVKKIDGTQKVAGHGSSDMPVWGQVFEKAEVAATDEAVQDKVVALAHYVRSIQVAGNRY